MIEQRLDTREERHTSITYMIVYILKFWTLVLRLNVNLYTLNNWQHSYGSHLNKLTKEDIGQSATWKNWKVLLAGSKLTRTSADLVCADQHMKRALKG